MLFVDRKHKKAITFTQQASFYVAQMLEQEPIITTFPEFYPEQTWRELPAIAGGFLGKLGGGMPCFSAQEIRLDFHRSQEASKIKNFLNGALDETTLWQDLKRKKVMAYNLARAENAQCVVPMYALLKGLGFVVEKETDEFKNTLSCLTFRLPNDVQASEPPDIKAFLKEVLHELSSSPKKTSNER